MATENPTETALARKGTLRWFLEDQESPYQARLRRMLGDRMPQFGASLLNLAHSSEKFEKVRPSSIITAGIIAVTLDLPIDRNLGFAWIIPYGELAQFQIGYKGFIQLALRSGHYAGMNAVPINDAALGGFDAIGDPIIHWEAVDETEPAIGYAFAWKLTSGFTKIVYWSKKKVEAHALRYSQAYKQQKKDSPWFTNFDSMGLKTVVKSGLTKWGIMSVESRLQIAFERDQSAAIDVDAKPIYPDADDSSTSANTNTAATDEQPAGAASPAPSLDDLAAKLQTETIAGSAADLSEKINTAGGVAGVTATPDVVAEAGDLLADDATQPHLKLVPEVKQVEQVVTIADMTARLEQAPHVSDVRALQILWAGSKSTRSDEEKATINQLCDARIKAIKAASRKGNGEK